MKSKLSKLSKIILILYSTVLLLTSFQNCGQVAIEAVQLPSEPPPVPLQIENVTFLKIDNTITNIYRAVFVVDMSDSMYSGPCPDSIDVMIPDVNPSPNCLGPTGVDPQGNRFNVMLNWLDDLQTKIDDQILTNDQAKILVLPYSGPTDLKWSVNEVNRVANPLGLGITEGFVSVAMARNYLYFLWAIESKYHGNAYSSRIPQNIKNAVITSNSVAGPGNVKASTGTSMVAPAFEKMNVKLNAELLSLKTTPDPQNPSANLLAKSHFELVFMSDGVPKPHALHIEQAVRYIWNRKKSICDGWAQYPMNSSCENGAPTSQFGVAQVDATSCYQRCGDYLKQYADTGAINIPGSEVPICTQWGCVNMCQQSMCVGWSDGSNFSER
jgi:hypothetical protein